MWLNNLVDRSYAVKEAVMMGRAHVVMWCLQLSAGKLVYAKPFRLRSSQA